ncbi:ShlB/FhaC/HecB family hemolysin secretion/activation protein [Acinetobacter sp. ANC 4280]|uniref:ShlB/FhaC/HecB family hemolysin secretion/activation protein n=2 Tax=Acinetobacter terrae TaxID=2731247 RepID=A0A8E4FAJ7_9GAMM|nr:ShlB/FhaC/HecB family hemolysin secretion/activation protein [Acinetobacter terrae]
MRYPYTLLALSISVCSMNIKAEVIPNSGQLLQQQQREKLSAPQADVDIENLDSPFTLEDSQVQIDISQISIEGNTRFSNAGLHALVAEVEGRRISLSQLNAVVQRITQYYYNHGYIYSYAYLPEQTLEDGKVRIAVLEARYEQTVVNNKSRTQDWLIHATVAPLKKGEQIDNQTLEQQLKLINRLSGVYSSNVLGPGETPGSSQLTVDVQDDSMLSGYVGADNYGSSYTNRARLSAGIVLNNLAGLGDELSFEGLTSGQRLNYGKVGYVFTFTGMGTRLGASYSYLDYELGKELKVLGVEGNAAQSSVWISQPALLSNTSEVLVTLQYDHKQLEDDIKLNQNFRHRDIDLITARLESSHYDQFAGGGLTQLGASTSYGRVKFKNADTASVDAQTANTQGDFYTASLNLSRLQSLGNHGTQGYVAIYGQYSPYNLDSAEQYSSGGPFNVRGYESSQFSGSSGYFATVELRQSLFSNDKHQIGAKIFVDTADVTLNAERWIGVTGDNTARISSAGLGLNWSSVWNIQANAEVGFPIGSTPSQLSDRDNNQYWLNLRKTF